MTTRLHIKLCLFSAVLMAVCAYANTPENANATNILQLVEKAEKGGALNRKEVAALAGAMGVEPRELRFIVIDAETREPIGGAFVKGEGMATSELPVHRDLPEKTTMPLPFETKASKDGKANITVFGASSLDDVTVIAIADGYKNTSYCLGSFDFGKIYYLTMTRKQ